MDPIEVGYLYLQRNPSRGWLLPVSSKYRGRLALDRYSRPKNSTGDSTILLFVVVSKGQISFWRQIFNLHFRPVPVRFFVFGLARWVRRSIFVKNRLKRAPFRRYSTASSSDCESGEYIFFRCFQTNWMAHRLFVVKSHCRHSLWRYDGIWDHWWLVPEF